MSRVVLSSEFPEMSEKLREFGYEVIHSENIIILPDFEAKHADIQCLKINETVFVLRECEKLSESLLKTGYKVILTERGLGRKYPKNILLNAVFFHNKLYGRLDSIDSSVISYCKSNGIELINVNQGYTKCSTVLLDDCFITADRGIFDAMTANGEEGLLISSGNIDLKGVDYGFIGGCCFCNKGKVFFSGDIRLHSDYTKIKTALSDYETVLLSNEKLYDIGGFVVL